MPENLFKASYKNKWIKLKRPLRRKLYGCVIVPPGLYNTLLTWHQFANTNMKLTVFYMEIVYFQAQDKFEMPVLQREKIIYSILHIEGVLFGWFDDFWTVLKWPFPDTNTFISDTIIIIDCYRFQYSCLENPRYRGAWWAAVYGVTQQQQHYYLEKEMATHSSVLAWRIPGMGEPGGLLSMGLHRVRHDWSDLAVAAAALLSD